MEKHALAHKIAAIISGAAVLVRLINKVRAGLFPFDPTYPAIAVFTICEAVICRKEKRKWAYIFIAGAVISLAFFILELLLM